METRRIVDPGSLAAAPFRELRLAVEQKRDVPEGEGSSVLVMSPARSEGRTTIAASLAVVAAADGQRVMLVDGCLDEPRLHEFFAGSTVAERVGEGSDGHSSRLLRYVGAEGSIDMVVPDAPGGARANRGARLTRAIEHARTTYDLVVVDTPPILEAPEVVSLAADPANVVVVAVSESGRRGQLREALRKLELVGANVAGLVVNRRAPALGR